MRTYCDKSASLWQRVEEKVKEIKGQVVAWGGAGQLFNKIVNGMMLPEMTKFAVVVDIDGRNAMTPAAFSERYQGVERDDPVIKLPILVTTIQHRESVLEDIKRLGSRTR